MKFVLFALLAFTATALASDVLNLTPDNFDDHVGGDSPALVEFYAPWCGHCKNLAPEWEIAATAFKGLAPKVAAVDADKHRELGGRFEVKGFPTIKYFAAGDKKGEAYNGGRTAADIVDFLNKKAGTNARVKTAPTDVITLDPSNFNQVVKDEKKNVLVEFYAPWCGHCKALAPTWEKVASSFAGESNVAVTKIDCDAHGSVCGEYGVSGYPTIKFFPAGEDKSAQEYNGGRSPDDFVKYLNDKAGTQRTVGGGYTDAAGRIEELDELVEKFHSGDKKSVLAEIEAKVKSVASHVNAEFAKFYALTAKKMHEAADYAEKESARLTRMLSKSINPKARQQFSKRLNIVKRFLHA